MRLRQRGRAAAGELGSPPLDGAGAPVLPPPGWYRDPAAPGVVRFWDGGGWTLEAADLPAPPPVAPVTNFGHAAPPDEVTAAGDDDQPSDSNSSAPSAPDATAGQAAPVETEVAEVVVRSVPEEPGPLEHDSVPLRGDTGHYVLHHPLTRSTGDPADAAVTLVTGQLPKGYNRITVECEKGDVIEATVTDDPATSSQFFVAPVRHRVLRVTATARGGRYGVFLDVDRLEGGV